MKVQVELPINENLFLRDPESTELGRSMVKKAVDLISELGFEEFTFKKLACEIHSTEASVYRYFENKHRLLLYITDLYWRYMDYLLKLKLENVADKNQRLTIILNLLTHKLHESKFNCDEEHLNKIIINESSKVYLTRDVSVINNINGFGAYNNLCSQIAEVIASYDPKYKYPKSLSSTLVETSHRQRFFSVEIKELTDIVKEDEEDFSYNFMEDLLFKTLNLE